MLVRQTHLVILKALFLALSLLVFATPASAHIDTPIPALDVAVDPVEASSDGANEDDANLDCHPGYDCHTVAAYSHRLYAGHTIARTTNSFPIDTLDLHSSVVFSDFPPPRYAFLTFL